MVFLCLFDAAVVFKFVVFYSFRNHKFSDHPSANALNILGTLKNMLPLLRLKNITSCLVRIVLASGNPNSRVCQKCKHVSIFCEATRPRQRGSTASLSQKNKNLSLNGLPYKCIAKPLCSFEGPHKHQRQPDMCCLTNIQSLEQSTPKVALQSITKAPWDNGSDKQDQTNKFVRPSPAKCHSMWSNKGETTIVQTGIPPSPTMYACFVIATIRLKCVQTVLATMAKLSGKPKVHLEI
jgi:hypothetical protein